MKKQPLDPKRGAVTPERAEAVLAWHRSRQTLEFWSRLYDIPRSTLTKCIALWVSPEQWEMEAAARPAIYPLPLTVEQMLPVMGWWRNKKSQVEIAREQGLTIRQVDKIIRRGGAPRYVLQRAGKIEVVHGRRPNYRELRQARRQTRLQRMRNENAARFQTWIDAGSPVNRANDARVQDGPLTPKGGCRQT